MEGLIAKIGQILRIGIKTESTGNPEIRARNTEGNITIDQSTNKITVNTKNDAEGRKNSATNSIWKALLEMEKESPTFPLTMDLLPVESVQEIVEGNPYIKSVIRQADNYDSSRQMNIIKEAEEHRPYVPEQLWELFHAYGLLSINPGIKIQTCGIEKAMKWWLDPIVNKKLKEKYMPLSIREWDGQQRIYLGDCRRAIKTEIANQARILTQGE